MKIGWLLKSRKLASLGGMLSVAVCTVIGGSLYNWRQERAVKLEEEKRIQAQLEAEAELASLAAEEEARMPQLSESQIDLLNQIENAIEQQQLAKAADLMLDNGERLWELYHEFLDGEPYLFCEGKLFKEIQGTGMVLRKPSTIFYGAFVDGRPEGQGTALQVIEIDYPRFDYSTGIWSEGKMNGEGSVGYRYYEGLGEENRAVSRTGVFVEDKLDGDVTYSTTNAENTVVTWNMIVESGVLVLDDNWIFDEEKESYQLVTNEDGGHAFVTTEEGAKSMMFQNMIPWE